MDLQQQLYQQGHQVEEEDTTPTPLEEQKEVEESKSRADYSDRATSNC